MLDQTKWTDERFHIVDSLSPVLVRFRNLEAVSISRNWENISGDVKAEAHPMLFAALSRSPGLKRFITREFMPIPDRSPLASNDCELIPSTFLGSLGHACLQLKQALRSQFYAQFVAFELRPDEGNKVVECDVKSLQLKK